MGWQECSVAPTDWYDRYLYLNAGKSCLTIQRQRGTFRWVIKDGPILLSDRCDGHEEDVKREAVRILRKRSIEVLLGLEGAD